MTDNKADESILNLDDIIGKKADFMDNNRSDVHAPIKSAQQNLGKIKLITGGKDEFLDKSQNHVSGSTVEKTETNTNTYH